MDEGSTRETLKRVALALSVSENVFLEDHSQVISTVPAMSEASELLKLFSTIIDPEARRACLQYVRDLAELTNMAAE